jgi:uncharacterized protein YoxC
LSFWSNVFLGVIAVSTLAMAIAQVAVIAYAWTIARRVDRVLERVEREIKPLAESLNAMARDGARMTALATGQVERVDKALNDLSARIDQTASAIQSALAYPMREGAAAVAGVKAALDFLREVTKRSASGGSRSEDEDTLFIG